MKPDPVALRHTYCSSRAFASAGLDVVFREGNNISLATRFTVSGLLVLLVGAVSPALAGDTSKAARGIVTSIAGDSIMINLPSDTDVTFRVDASTRVVARGAGTKMRQATAQGASGVK